MSENIWKTSRRIDPPIDSGNQRAESTAPPVAKEGSPPEVEEGAPPKGLALALIDEIELTVEKMVAGGEGLGRHDGVPVFVPRSVPGDRLRVRVVERKADYGRAEILEILSPGEGRREAPCPHFSSCGGCDLQHIDETKQVELKAGAVRETLRRLGGIDLPRETEIVAGSPWGYRVRTQLHTSLNEQGEVQVGYHRRGSNELVPIGQCRILVPELEAMVPHLGGHLPAEGPRRLDLLAGDDGSVSTAPPVEGLPQGELSVTVGEFEYTLDARCFFQAHRTLTPVLVQKTIAQWKGELAIDLYAGVGLFSLPLAQNYDRVIAVEGSTLSARFARKNAKKYQLASIEVIAKAVESQLAQGLPDADRLVVDPPRNGLSKGVRKAILQNPPRRITYVSCHPATLARDLRQLTTEAYRLDSMVLLDLFPQSGHMEVIAQLERLDSSSKQ